MKDENTLLIGDITSWIDKLFIKNHLTNMDLSQEILIVNKFS